MSVLTEQAVRAAEEISSAEEVLVVTHIDADGICAAALASLILDRVEKPYEIRYLKKLDAAVLEKLRGEKGRLIWFTDLGSGALAEMKGLRAVIADHHIPYEPPARVRGDLLALAEVMDCDIPHVNPHLEGRDGGTDLSGAGAVHLIAKEIEPGAARMAHLAVVGAVGDLQDRGGRGLAGTNRTILEEGVRAGVIELVREIGFFGRESRPVHKMLQYASEPTLPDLAGDEEACIQFLTDTGIRLRDGTDWRRWIDLTKGERASLLTRLREHLRAHGFEDEIEREVYLLPMEEEGTPLHEAKEFATLLNSCGRYDKAHIGLEIARGNRAAAYKAGLSLQEGHKRNLVEYLQVVRSIGIIHRNGIQYFHAGESISETVVGTVAGMALNSGLAERSAPLFAFANAEDGVKVSCRASRQLVQMGLDLSEVARIASGAVGGGGGGHRIAAGATIPAGTEEAFLAAAAKVVERQMRRGGDR
ncbi:MAG: DHH family phosphoesterase [Candidatus Thermoplasmatota archaeon]